MRPGLDVHRHVLGLLREGGRQLLPMRLFNSSSLASASASRAARSILALSASCSGSSSGRSTPAAPERAPRPPRDDRSDSIAAAPLGHLVELRRHLRRVALGQRHLLALRRDLLLQHGDVLAVPGQVAVGDLDRLGVLDAGRERAAPLRRLELPARAPRARAPTWRARRASCRAPPAPRSAPRASGRRCRTDRRGGVAAASAASSASRSRLNTGPPGGSTLLDRLGEERGGPLPGAARPALGARRSATGVLADPLDHREPLVALVALILVRRHLDRLLERHGY